MAEGSRQQAEEVEAPFPEAEATEAPLAEDRHQVVAEGEEVMEV
jgi:hypothetical protein